MRNFTTLFILFFLAPCILHSQPKWDLIHPDNQNLWAQKIFFIDFQTGWAYSTSYVYRTSNSGHNWQNITPSQTGYHDNLFFINANTGWVSAGKEILKSTNGGLNWILQSIPYPSASIIWNINSIFFLNESTGYLTTNYEQDVGQSYYGYNFIAKTTNGGTTWLQLYNSDQCHECSVKLYSMTFFDELNGYGVFQKYHPHGQITNYSVLRVTTNGGNNWINISQNFNSNYWRSTQYINIDTIFILAQYSEPPSSASYVRKTTDKGKSWETVLGSPYIQNDFHFIDNNIGFIAGEEGKLTWTSNGGQNWDLQQLNTTYDLNSIFFLNKDTGWVLTALGGIFRTFNASTVNITPISSEIPNSFDLKQNYPNPFNPATKIRFDIPESLKQVKLSVYNSIGQEVEVLIDEQLQPGIYEYDFNASSYASGVYFYRLEAGEFSETKRMVLVK